MPVDQLPHPPPPPRSPRHVRLYRHQWLGLGLLGAVVAAALGGAFGESFRTDSSRGRGLDVSIWYADRYRYKQLNSLQVAVTNRSGAVADTLTVALDTGFANRFSTVRSIPAMERPYRIPLTDVGPGETRLAIIELQGERYGRHEGELSVFGADSIRIPLAIWIFP